MYLRKWNHYITIVVKVIALCTAFLVDPPQAIRILQCVLCEKKGPLYNPHLHLRSKCLLHNYGLSWSTIDLVLSRLYNMFGDILSIFVMLLCFLLKKVRFRPPFHLMDDSFDGKFQKLYCLIIVLIWHFLIQILIKKWTFRM